MKPPNQKFYDAPLHNKIGVCYQKLGNNGDAMKEFTKAIEADPYYIEPLFHRMNIHKIEGEYEQALEHAIKIRGFDPEYPDLNIFISELEILLE